MRLKKYEFDEFGRFIEDPDEHIICYKGGSSSSNITNNYTTFAPVTKIETDKLAEAIEKGAQLQAQTQMQATAVEMQATAAELALEKAKIKAELQQRQEFLETLKEGGKKAAGIIIIGGAIYLYTKKKGGRKK